MKNKPRIRVLIPSAAPDLDSIFPNNRWADDARALFYYMNREKRIMEQNRDYNGGISRESGYVSVNATELKVGKNKKGERIGLGLSNRYNIIRDELVALGSIEIYTKENGVRPYTPGLYPRLWRPLFKDPNLTGGRMYRQEFITNPRTIANMRDFYNRKYKDQRKEFLAQNEWYKPNLEWAERMYLDEAAITYAESQSPKKAEQLLGSISMFNSGTGRFISRCEFAGRIHSFITRLEKELRPFLRVEDEKDLLIMRDVSSAQPFLIGSLLNHASLISIIPEFAPVLDKIQKRQSEPATRLFLEDCINGNLYKRLADASGLSEKKVKNQIFQHILFSSASNQHKKRKVKKERMKFRALFSSFYRPIYDSITDLKRTRSSTLQFVMEITAKGGQGKMYSGIAMICQRLEARIFIDLITQRLNKAGVITIGIHDAWVLKRKDETFDLVFYQVFEELGIRPPKLSKEVLESATDNIEPESSTEK